MQVSVSDTFHEKICTELYYILEICIWAFPVIIVHGIGICDSFAVLKTHWIPRCLITTVVTLI